MTFYKCSFYKCPCGYATKDESYARIHSIDPTDSCEAVEFQSVFPDKGGIIAMAKNAKHSTFFAWFDTEESLLDTQGAVEYKFTENCDEGFIKLQNDAIRENAVVYFDGVPMVKNDVATRLFESIA
ncbi:hypothetical protein ATCVCan0610SP_365R [Acanthocystis turfacea Chlorella virus Can0610SP]|nr:hypothetical protein ATCVCan0610SP_365R [Acanthocystis turfacea Chlorella virus Can0610SP]